MGKMKEALVKLARKITGKEVEDTNSISNVINFMADNADVAKKEDIPHLYMYEINQSDYSFNILLPFRLKKDYDIGSEEDVLDDADFKDDLKKIIAFYTANSSLKCFFSGLSDDTSNANIKGSLSKNANDSIYHIGMVLVNFSSGDEETYDNQFNLDNGEIISAEGEFSDSDLYISYKVQLF